MDEHIVVDCNISYTDYRRFAWFSLWNRGELVKFLITLSALILAGLAFVIVYRIVANGFDAFLNMISVSTVLAVAIPIAYYVIIHLSIRRRYAQAKPVMDAMKHYEFTPDHVVTDSFGLLNQNGILGYQTFLRAFQTKHAFYLYIGPTQAFIIPVRCMDNESVEGLGNILQENMGERFIKNRWL